MESEPDMRSYFFKPLKWEYCRCLAPGMSCKKAAIRAHSIQNSGVLDLLSRNGHAKVLGKRVDWEQGPQFGFEDIGRNRASTFSGFCSLHDSSIFRPLDTATLDVNNKEQLFLLAYRAIAKEMHASMDAAYKIQSAYTRRIDRGIDDPNSMSPTGIMATRQLMKSYELFCYMSKFDVALLRKDFEQVRHQIIALEVERPTIAVSSLFSLDNVSAEDGWVNVALTVLPTSETKALAIFTGTPNHWHLIANQLQRIFQASGQYQKYELSKLVLNYCENFVISPDHFDTWPKSKAEAIKSYFVSTLFHGNMNFEDERLYLF